MTVEGKLVRPCPEAVFRPAERSVYSGPQNARRSEIPAIRAGLAEEQRD